MRILPERETTSFDVGIRLAASMGLIFIFWYEGGNTMMNIALWTLRHGPHQNLNG